jgi:hypothetical protein
VSVDAKQKALIERIFPKTLEALQNAAKILPALEPTQVRALEHLVTTVALETEAYHQAELQKSRASIASVLGSIFEGQPRPRLRCTARDCYTKRGPDGQLYASYFLNMPDMTPELRRIVPPAICFPCYDRLSDAKKKWYIRKRGEDGT